MRITVVGTGYVGLVTGTCFAESGNTVTCIDIDADKVKRLSKGEITIYEPGLEKLFLRNLREDRLKFTTELADGVKDSLLIILALPTPPGGDGSADLSAILKVAGDLGKIINDYRVILDKSTVPVGTAEKVQTAISANCKAEFDVVSNPEFLREGFAVEDFMKPDRVIVGTGSQKARKIISDLYAPFMRQDNRIIFMDERSAELTKYAANSFLATKISFMNEVAILCEKFGADVDLIRRGLGTDERIGKRFLFPGIGFGGSCFPKDVKALVKSAKGVDYEFKILQAVMEVNEKQKLSLVPRIKKYFNNDLKGKKIAVWGLSFKPNTDDIREAPSLFVIRELLKEGSQIAAFDPEAMANTRRELGEKIELTGQYDVIKNCDALVIATEWNEFRTPDFDKMSSVMKRKVIFDGRNVYELQKMKELGFYYESIGRKTVSA
jgi:UDPglucose 6-dehydrogenase